jgi:hypothetical protein
MFEKTPIVGLEVYSCLRTRFYDTPTRCTEGNTAGERTAGENDLFRFIDSCIHCTVSDTTGGGVTDENGYFRFRKSKNKPRLAYFRIESEGKYIGTIPLVERLGHHGRFLLMFVDGRADTLFIDMAGETPHYTRRKEIRRWQRLLIKVGIK